MLKMRKNVEMREAPEPETNYKGTEIIETYESEIE